MSGVRWSDIAYRYQAPRHDSEALRAYSINQAVRRLHALGGPVAGMLEHVTEDMPAAGGTGLANRQHHALRATLEIAAGNVDAAVEALVKGAKSQ